MRILKVPFYERKSWGFDEKERVKIQNICLKADSECLQLIQVFLSNFSIILVAPVLTFLSSKLTNSTALQIQL